jgi:hypothetical protein
MKRSPRESMEAAHQDHGPSSAIPDVANLGVVRPPLVYLATIVMGAVLEFAWPSAFFPVDSPPRSGARSSWPPQRFSSIR